MTVPLPILLILVAAGELFPRGLAPIDTGLPGSASARPCAACHAEVDADWQASRHGRAFTNAIFQREYRDKPLEWCVHCHAPLREQLEQVRAGGGPLADEGITCAACHLREGHMLARRRSPGSPHETEAREDFGGPGFCAGCHQFNFPVVEPAAAGARGAGHVAGYTIHPMQDTVNQHARGPRAAQECLACHRAGSQGHRFPGGHDAGMLARAITLRLCRDGTAPRARGLQIRLTNDGAGHNVPTGDLHRHLVLRAWRAGAPERLQETVLGRRFELAEGGGKRTTSDTTIPPGATRTVRVAWDALGGAGARSPEQPISIELRLVYTIDEFPLRGRELAEPTWATMIAREATWTTLERCRSAPRRGGGDDDEPPGAHQGKR